MVLSQKKVQLRLADAPLFPVGGRSPKCGRLLYGLVPDALNNPKP